MKKRIELLAIGLLLGWAAAASGLFAVGQQTLKALSSPSTPSVDPQPLSLTQSPGIDAKPLTEMALSPPDQINFQRIMKYARDHDLSQRPIGNVMQAIAEQLLGTPYQEKLLDSSSTETLTLSLQKLDCVLFIESVLAITRGIIKQDYSTSTYIQNIQEQRYINGKLNGYCSRLHYFSEWLVENQKRNIVKSLTAELDGVPLNKTLNFMSTHWQTYPQLAHSEANRHCISKMESTLDNASIRYIPTNQIPSKFAALKSGDVIAIATKVPGLDVTHTGLVYRSQNGDIGLIHSAPVRGVMISPNLQRYVERLDDAIGILVARPVDPRTP